MEGSFVLSVENSAFARGAERAFGVAPPTCRLNEVMLGTLLRRGKPAREIAEMFGLRASAVAEMRERLGI